MVSEPRIKSGAFLVELLIVIAVFAVCAAAGISAAATADRELKYSEKLTSSAHLAGDIAESYIAGLELSEKYPLSDGRINIQTDNGELCAVLSERTGENGVSYLDITVSDEKYVYTSITCARRGVGTDE